MLCFDGLKNLPTYQLSLNFLDFFKLWQNGLLARCLLWGLHSHCQKSCVFPCQISYLVTIIKEKKTCVNCCSFVVQNGSGLGVATSLEMTFTIGWMELPWMTSTPTGHLTSQMVELMITCTCAITRTGRGGMNLTYLNWLSASLTCSYDKIFLL